MFNETDNGQEEEEEIEMGPFLIDMSYSEITYLTPIDIGNFKPHEDFSIEDIISLNNGNVVFKPKKTNPNDIVGLYSTQRVFNAEDAVKSLASVRSIFNIDQLSFSLEREPEGNDSIIYCLQQLYKGVIVFGGYFCVFANNEGEAIKIYGKYMSDIDLDVIPRITAAEAKEKAVLEDRKYISEAALSLKTNPQGKDLRLCWRLAVSHMGESIDREKYIFIDAITGEYFTEAQLKIFAHF